MRVSAIAAIVAVCLVPAVADVASAASRAGEPFPTITLPALRDGAPLSIAQFRGRKLLVHQFASW